LNIEFVVGPDPAFPGRMVVALFALRDELALRNDWNRHHVGAFIEEFGCRIHQHTVLFDDVQEAIFREARTVRNLFRQRRREFLHFVTDEIAIPIRNNINLGLARANKQRDALRPNRHVPGVRHQRVETDMETWR
jgi:hypothetical protein